MPTFESWGWSYFEHLIWIEGKRLTDHVDPSTKSSESAALLVISEEAFDHRFRPMKHPEAHFDSWGGLGIETFGADWALVQKLHPSRVWTVNDGCDEGEDQWILPGIHHVNRVVYLYTRHQHYFAPLVVEVSDTSSNADSSTISAQISQANRLIRDTKRA